MSEPEKPDDKISAAIAAAEQAPPAVDMAAIPATMSTGRPVQVVIPIDMTDLELMEVTAWMLTGLLKMLQANRARTAGGRIIVARGILPT